MKVRVRLLPSRREVVVEVRRGCLYEVIRRLGYPLDAVVALYDGEPVPEDTCLGGEEALVELYLVGSG